jgi:glycosyltransferase involved in cell wall biosynthesis
VHESGATGDVQEAATTRRIRVLVAIKCLGFGGAERLVVDMVANGDTRAFAYEVAYVLEAEDALVPALAATGTPVHALGARGNGDLRWMARLRTLLLTGHFDVVHFHLPYTAALGRLVVASLPRAVRPPVVYTEHSLWNRMAIVVKAINRAGIGLDRSLVVVSQAAHDALPAALKDRARVIVLGVDLSRSEALAARRTEIRAAVRDELGVPEGDTLVLTVANLRPEKAYDVLLEAARLVEGRALPIRFAAVGRGPLEDELHRRHRALGLDGRFTFLGQRDDVLRLLVGSDVFVLASRQEGLPVVLMEATSVGMPIVATAVGGVPQVLTDGTDGLVVPPDDPPALAAAVERLAADPGLRERLGHAAHERSAMFDVAGACRQIEEIYRTLAGVPQ